MSWLTFFQLLLLILWGAFWYGVCRKASQREDRVSDIASLNYRLYDGRNPGEEGQG